jgi:hypothetical protein
MGEEKENKGAPGFQMNSSDVNAGDSRGYDGGKEWNGAATVQRMELKKFSAEIYHGRFLYEYLESAGFLKRPRSVHVLAEISVRRSLRENP